jgi:hypothetical protein
MCFSFLGRLQTRSVALLGALLACCLAALGTGQRDYLALFGLTAAVGVALDLTCYGWLIGYQPRWLSLLLAALEFWVIKWIMEWPYPFELRLHTRQALSVYLAGWALSWCIIHAFLPRFHPRWAEDGGAVWQPRTLLGTAQPWPELGLRRRIFATALGLTALTLTPWLAGAILTPVGWHFTGLLLVQPLHAAALASATQAARSGLVDSPAAVLGWIAAIGRWPVQRVYLAVWGLSSWGWWLGLQFRSYRAGRSPRIAACWGALPVLLLPAPWLMLAAGAIWSLSPLRRYRPMIPGSRLATALGAISLAVWAMAWLRLATGPATYLIEPDWQMVTWLSQREEAPVTIATPAYLHELVQGLGGQIAVDMQTPAKLFIADGDGCRGRAVLFRQADRCIVARSP